ncbi:hypothetical protein CEQ23_04710 [Burkholderia cepacia]|uniref:Uncharacterized protein n=1 Tax=Burkholderia cepacia TaxID=292 RepID=A0ABM6NYS7_BURCE|nr:hypothetical protein APZ15_34770 [Burkholderia cepacia ATCC 25416]ASE92891.1 hypothetical protein CEQ23_04710 [Burkholderia cepacia]ATF80086.1 hypothetical protein CO711_22065 [Burkholderia cepacia]
MDGIKIRDSITSDQPDLARDCRRELKAHPIAAAGRFERDQRINVLECLCRSHRPFQANPITKYRRAVPMGRDVIERIAWDF